ncbi:stage II sporulation protein M [Bacillota bacterium LX-D]|nr:stage II sporulation protein M [Bacillota bacterium LX-D]
MAISLWDKFKKHVNDNIILYISISIVLLLGIVCGSLGVKMLENNEEQDLINLIDSFCTTFPSSEVQSGFLLKKCLIANFKILSLIWFLGLTVIGAPLILIVVGIKGFYLGFTAGFLIQEKGLLGILFTTLALMPQNIFNMPALMIAGVLAISFSFWLLKRHVREGRIQLWRHFISYTLCLSVLALLFTIGSFIEAYFTPMLIKLVIAYL